MIRYVAEHVNIFFICLKLLVYFSFFKIYSIPIKLCVVKEWNERGDVPFVLNNARFAT